MKEKLALLENVDLSLFYCVTIREYSLDLQGRMSSDTIDYCKRKLGVENLNLDPELNYLRGHNNNINIALT